MTVMRYDVTGRNARKICLSPVYHSHSFIPLKSSRFNLTFCSEKCQTLNLKVLLLFNSYHLNWEFIGQIKTRIWHELRERNLSSSDSNHYKLVHIVEWDLGFENTDLSQQKNTSSGGSVFKSVNGGIEFCQEIGEISISPAAQSLLQLWCCCNFLIRTFTWMAIHESVWKHSFKDISPCCVIVKTKQ